MFISKIIFFNTFQSGEENLIQLYSTINYMPFNNNIIGIYCSNITPWINNYITTIL